MLQSAGSMSSLLRSVSRYVAGVPRALGHPVVRTAAISVAVAFVLRLLFLRLAPWLWSFQAPVDLTTLVQWSHWAMADRDGAEPYALLVCVLTGWLLAGALLAWLRRQPRLEPGAVILSVIFVAYWVFSLPPRAPYPSPAPPLDHLCEIVSVASALVLAVLAILAVGSKPAEIMIVVGLCGVCFLRTSSVRPSDLECILAPALRLHHGFRLRDIYMQYDLLPSLLALGWRWLGGAAIQFSSGVMAWGYLLLFLGLFFCARKTFAQKWLAGPLLVTVVFARYYGQLADPVAFPQATPLRLDLWLLVMVVIRWKGLTHWGTALLLGALTTFSRSVGMLCLMAWGLTVGVAFGLRVIAAQGDLKNDLQAELRRTLPRLVPSFAIIVAWFVLVRLVYGRWGSDAVSLYRQLGVGMMRISPSSAFWWLFPVLIGTGYLAAREYLRAPTPRGEGILATVPLVTLTATYFFGRSHEHNLVNLSAGFVFCFFLGLDLVVSEARAEGRRVRGFAWIAAMAAVVASAHFYAAGFTTKAGTQVAQVTQGRPPPETNPPDPTPPIQCQELAAAIGHPRVYFFSVADYYFYDYCGYVPQGYFQPLYLALFTAPLAEQLAGLLRQGYVVVVPRDGRDWGNSFDGTIQPLLPPLSVESTPNYRIFRLRT